MSVKVRVKTRIQDSVKEGEKDESHITHNIQYIGIKLYRAQMHVYTYAHTLAGARVAQDLLLLGLLRLVAAAAVIHAPGQGLHQR